MDVLVRLEEHPDQSQALAHVNSVPALLDSERPSRDVVTLYGDPSAESVALALAAAVECHRTGATTGTGQLESVRDVGVWVERGAMGDGDWRTSTGQLVTQALEIPLDTLRATAGLLLHEFGQVIGRLVACLSMPDWPEGAVRAITVSLSPVVGLTAPVLRPLESVVEGWREADSLAFDYDGE